MNLDNMPDKVPVVRSGKHDWDKEYTTGAHWDTEEPSSNMPRFVELINGRKDVLDAGCGSGRDAIFLAKQGFSVTGVDISPVGINLARQRSKDTPKVKFEVSPIENLPFPDFSFDAAYSGYTLSGPTLPQQANELARVLRPNGILFVAMFTRTAYEEPNDRNEQNPQEFVLETFERDFEIKDQTVDTYTEEDDQGKHEHERLKLVLVKK